MTLPRIFLVSGSVASGTELPQVSGLSKRSILLLAHALSVVVLGRVGCHAGFRLVSSVACSGGIGAVLSDDLGDLEFTWFDPTLPLRTQDPYSKLLQQGSGGVQELAASRV